MAPLPPSCTTISAHNSCNRSRVQRRGQDDKPPGAPAKTTTKIIPSPPERSASFHGRSSLAPVEQRLMRRPKTQPDLLSGARRIAADYKEDARSCGLGAAERRVPAKVLVNVSVQGSLLGPLQVMASSEWTVADLVAAVVRLYVKEGRRPQLVTAEPSELSLHYSQFCLEGLDPKEKLIGLGSRNFFLCYKAARVDADAAVTTASTKTAGSCSEQAERASKLGIPWLRFIDSLF